MNMCLRRNLVSSQSCLIYRVLLLPSHFAFLFFSGYLNFPAKKRHFNCSFSENLHNPCLAGIGGLSLTRKQTPFSLITDLVSASNLQQAALYKYSPAALHSYFSFLSFLTHTKLSTQQS
ncbi:GQ67_04620T0 [Komagataella phaffii]|nr:GQ67_04620T0 [Komagataella phaffii]AOA70241.1 GQ68_04592T0 [Komagataella phaffii GS115]